MRGPNDVVRSNTLNSKDDRARVVVVGPSSTLTIPGIIVSQIVQALIQTNPIIRVEVDLGTNYDTGIHRAPSLASAHDEKGGSPVTSFRAPTTSRLRVKAFHQWISPDVGVAIAFVWPGIENEWIKQFLAAADKANVPSVVICASVPRSKRSKLVNLAEVLAGADLVMVGDDDDAAALVNAFGPSGPTVEMHQALSFRGKDDESAVHQITAFLPRDGIESLDTLLAAFDAIPEAWIDNYRLHIAMRYSGEVAPERVARSYHSSSVTLTGEDISTRNVETLCSEASAIIVADPAFDSRAYSVAVECGVAIVVLGAARLPDVGRGYVGALLADLSRPVSVNVALTHALRLAELQFPRPDSWDDLAKRLLGSPSQQAPRLGELHASRSSVTQKG